jgi:group I intron endonuclease
MKGIYKITCIVNGRFYIGSSSDITLRYHDHMNALSEKRHHNYKLQADFDLYGTYKFKLDLIQDGSGINRNELFLIEEGFIRSFQPYYNIEKTTTNAFLSRNYKKGRKKSKHKVHSQNGIVIQANPDGPPESRRKKKSKIKKLKTEFPHIDAILEKKRIREANKSKQ